MPAAKPATAAAPTPYDWHAPYAALEQQWQTAFADMGFTVGDKITNMPFADGSWPSELAGAALAAQVSLNIFSPDGTEHAGAFRIFEGLDKSGQRAVVFTCDVYREGYEDTYEDGDVTHLASRIIYPDATAGAAAVRAVKARNSYLDAYIQNNISNDDANDDDDDDDDDFDDGGDNDADDDISITQNGGTIQINSNQHVKMTRNGNTVTITISQ